MSMTFTICERVTVDGREVWSHGECDATFNVHNAGGYAILRSIGIEPDSCGSHEAADVVARCVTWRAMDAPARGIVEPSDTRGEGGARMVECGVDGAYVESRIARMEELARVAVAGGFAVGWS
jgi:hypothetical protein